MRVITDDIGAVVSLMRPIDLSYGQPMVDYIAEKNTPTNVALMPYYLPGHRMEINSILLKKDNDKVYKYQKYPLIALRLDVAEEVDEMGFVNYNLNIVILTLTDKNWKYEQRLENIFKPVLIPLYERFIAELGNVGLFQWEGDTRRPPHTRILRPFWGTEAREGNEKYIFSDPLDGIEIKNLQLKSTKKC
jgi:hypothetical protein